MSTLIYSMMVTLDGYIAAPDGSLDWGTVDEELHTYVNQQDAQLAGYLMGRGVWQEMDGFWQTAGDAPRQPHLLFRRRAFALPGQSMIKYHPHTCLNGLI